MKKLRPHLVLFLIVASLVTSGAACKTPDSATQERLGPITLEYWRVWDEEDSFTPIIRAYKEAHPNITINYRKFRYDEYEKQLLEAFAEDRAPDLFSIPESWIKRYQNRITPMPDVISVPERKTVGTIKKEVVFELSERNAPKTSDLRALYPDIVASDVILDGQLYGLPLSFETLVMFYNRDILNGAGVAEAPTTWTAIHDAVKKINRYDARGEIIRSGTAMGTGTNIASASDIASLIMIQNGAVMDDARGTVLWSGPTGSGRRDNPAMGALTFYSDFARPTKDVYSWNKSLPYSIDAFANGRTAILFGYPFYAANIRAANPNLNFTIAPVPQRTPDSPVNYASYWVETVSSRTKYPQEAWDFINFTATQPAAAKIFLEKTGRATALRSLMAEQAEKDDLRATIGQMLSSTNWYHGRDPLAADTIFRQLLDTLPDAPTTEEMENMIESAITKLNQTL